jgi:hypothetical protein
MTDEAEEPKQLSRNKEYERELVHLNAEIQNLSQAPFRKVLAEMLGCKPTIEALQAFANKAPDRWAQSVAIMAKNSGYAADKHVHEHSHHLLIGQMSDADLFARLRELETQLARSLDSVDQAVIEHIPAHKDD